MWEKGLLGDLVISASGGAPRPSDDTLALKTLGLEESSNVVEEAASALRIAGDAADTSSVQAITAPLISVLRGDAGQPSGASGLKQLPRLVEESASAIREAPSLPKADAIESIATPLVSAVAQVAKAAGDSAASIDETVDEATRVLSRLLDPDSASSPIHGASDCVDDSLDLARDLLAIALLVWIYKQRIQIEEAIAKSITERSQSYRNDLEVEFEAFLTRVAERRAELLKELDLLREEYTEKLHQISSESRKEYDLALIALQELRKRLLAAGVS